MKQPELFERSVCHQRAAQKVPSKNISYLQKIQQNSHRGITSAKPPSEIEKVQAKLTLLKKKIEIEHHQSRLGPDNKVNLPIHS